ncbi:MAG: hypothetical protein JRJ14_11155 [Deltaproteobacteria bacterium]|nr:hypothetical protein [Deltaproteobacteria bacterium]
MANNYTTPFARWARLLEIFIPGYMFGKSWGIATDVTADLYRAVFPPFLIDAAESLKGILHTTNTNLERLVSSSAGAVVGFLVIVILAIFMHLVLRDRKYIDSLRFTSVTLIPLAVMNGTLSHLTNTLLESLGMGATPEALTKSALEGPTGQIAMFCIFYMTSLWLFGGRTGVKGWHRWGVITVGIGFLVAYFACGLMITAGEWEVLLPQLQAALAAH